ncbi:hypothetical protein [Streptomyces lasiicapitis]|uniref:hypothetical protein n=1 Tax=Streptomyces lasiicapitis TaxID=1923961 RepID=UPI0036504DE3
MPFHLGLRDAQEALIDVQLAVTHDDELLIEITPAPGFAEFLDEVAERGEPPSMLGLFSRIGVGLHALGTDQEMQTAQAVLRGPGCGRVARHSGRDAK